MNEFGMYKLQLTHQEEIKRRGGNMISIFSNVIVQSFPIRFSGNTLMEKYLSIFFLVNFNKGLKLEGFLLKIDIFIQDWRHLRHWNGNFNI